MTTSYGLSLRLKELGVPQEGGEYYYVEDYNNGYTAVPSIVIDNSDDILCRALTLGEVVRMLGMNLYIEMKKDGTYDFMKRGELSYGNPSIYTNNQSPEEAAGNLLEETLKQKQL